MTGLGLIPRPHPTAKQTRRIWSANSPYLVSKTAVFGQKIRRIWSANTPYLPYRSLPIGETYACQATASCRKGLVLCHYDRGVKSYLPAVFAHIVIRLSSFNDPLAAFPTISRRVCPCRCSGVLPPRVCRTAGCCIPPRSCSLPFCGCLPAARTGRAGAR